MDFIKPYGIRRFVDTYLYMAQCLNCKEEMLFGVDNVFCAECGHDYSNYIIDLNFVKDKKNVVSITDKKRRKTISKKMALMILESQDYFCAYCDIPIRTIEYHFDHILPLSAGGATNLDNLVACCKECNLLASNKVFKSISLKRDFVLNRKLAR